VIENRKHDYKQMIPTYKWCELEGEEESLQAAHHGLDVELGIRRLLPVRIRAPVVHALPKSQVVEPNLYNGRIDQMDAKRKVTANPNLEKAVHVAVVPVVDQSAGLNRRVSPDHCLDRIPAVL
jgi:hypothetical protein